jgi:hypothetical protein
MRDDARIHFTGRAMKEMSVEQFLALQRNIAAEGKWETQTEATVVWSMDHIGVNIGGMYIGIESDGYTHS